MTKAPTDKLFVNVTVLRKWGVVKNGKLITVSICDTREEARNSKFFRKSNKKTSYKIMPVAICY